VERFNLGHQPSHVVRGVGNAGTAHDLRDGPMPDLAIGGVCPRSHNASIEETLLTRFVEDLSLEALMYIYPNVVERHVARRPDHSSPNA
jgi:hypothetical protein